MSLFRYWEFLKAPIRFIRSHRLRYWLSLFFIINIGFGVAGGSNAGIRFATLHAMVEHHSFKIDWYYRDSVDWSRTPDGHYYSTKAPGPIFLAFPLYWALDKVVTFSAPNLEEREHLRSHYKGITQPIVCLCLIAIPFAWVACLCLSWLSQLGASFAALELTLLAFLFGNTADFFTNTFFNHALTAWMLLALGYALMKRSYAWAGFLFGWTLLTEYSVAPLLLVVVWLVFRHTSSARARLLAFWRILLGAIVPAVLWIWYHVSCFGSPFILPYRYENPIFANTMTKGPNLWGILGAFPNPRIVLEFLMGPTRGILWVAPWIFLVMASSVYFKTKRRIFRESAIWATLTYSAFLVSLWLFSSYGSNWHGGDTPGPRFLCAAFPGFAVLLGVYFDALPLWARRALQVTVSISLVFYILVFAVLLFPNPGLPLWKFYVFRLFTSHAELRWARLVFLVSAFTLTFWARSSNENTKALPLSKERSAIPDVSV